MAYILGIVCQTEPKLTPNSLVCYVLGMLSYKEKAKALRNAVVQLSRIMSDRQIAEHLRVPVGRVERARQRLGITKLRHGHKIPSK